MAGSRGSKSHRIVGSCGSMGLRPVGTSQGGNEDLALTPSAVDGPRSLPVGYRRSPGQAVFRLCALRGPMTLAQERANDKAFARHRTARTRGEETPWSCM